MLYAIVHTVKYHTSNKMWTVSMHYQSIRKQRTMKHGYVIKVTIRSFIYWL